uniref:TonB family protein n=1 Tax=candidate division WOR-3 bacterium TaxID=2052148 RepID=A0A7C4U8U0_UNCW3
MKKLLLSMVLLVMFGCVKEERFSYKGEKGGTLIVASFEEPTTLNPLYPPISGYSPITYLLFSSLHKFDKNGKVMPCIASSWEFSEDLTKITYYIDRNSKWSDGSPITQKDILKTFEAMKDPKNNYPMIGRLKYIKNVKPIGNNGVQFEFTMVYADEILNSNIFPLPAKLIEEKLNSPSFKEMPELTSGPYKLNQWKKGEYIELLANENYIYGRPPVDRFVFWFPTSIDELIDEMKLGHIDIVLNFPPDKAKDINLPNYKILIESGNSYTFLGWNLNLFKDKRLRTALTMAIDRQNIIQNVLKGYGELSYGPIPSNHWAFDEGIKGLFIGYNAQKAMDIIRSLGYIDKNRDRYFDNLNVEILVDQNDEIKVKVAEMIVDYLKKAGVNSSVKKLNTIDFITRLEKGDFSAFILSWNVPREFEPGPVWSSTGIYNFVKYKNPDIDNLIEKGILTLDKKESKKIWSEFQRIIVEDIPYTFLYVASNISFIRDGIEGIDRTDKRLISEKIDEIYIPSSSRPATTFAFEELGKHFRETSTVQPTKKIVTVETAEDILRRKLLSQPSPDTLKPVEKKEETPVTKPVEKPVEEVKEEKKETPTQEEKQPQVELPKPIKIAMPTTPEAAKRLGLKGTVFVKVLIDENGDVIKAEVVKSFGGGVCDQEAINTAMKWKFSPGKINGVPAQMEQTIPINFK